MLSDFFAGLPGPASPATFAFVAGVALIAGFSRGLTGFGAGMIFIPLASGVFGPATAIGLMWTVDTPTMFPVALRSIRYGQMRETLRLFVGWIIATPLGLWLLNWLDPLTVRWFICAMILSAMALLLAGWSYKGKPTAMLAFVTGLVAGTTGGLTGLSGPPIVLLWLAAAAATSHNVRDNLNLFFLMVTVVNAVLLPWYGILTWPVAKLGLLLAIPYGVGVYAGALGFHRISDRNYRRAAYIVIGIAALLALPLLDGMLGRR